MTGVTSASSDRRQGGGLRLQAPSEAAAALLRPAVDPRLGGVELARSIDSHTSKYGGWVGRCSPPTKPGSESASHSATDLSSERGGEREEGNTDPSPSPHSSHIGGGASVLGFGSRPASRHGYEPRVEHGDSQKRDMDGDRSRDRDRDRDRDEDGVASMSLHSLPSPSGARGRDGALHAGAGFERGAFGEQDAGALHDSAGTTSHASLPSPGEHWRWHGELPPDALSNSGLVPRQASLEAGEHEHLLETRNKAVAKHAPAGAGGRAFAGGHLGNTAGSAAPGSVSRINSMPQSSVTAAGRPSLARALSPAVYRRDVEGGRQAPRASGVLHGDADAGDHDDDHETRSMPLALHEDPLRVPPSQHVPERYLRALAAAARA